MIIVTLPWPAKALHPNARLHWRKRADAARKARHDAGWLAVEAGAEPSAADAVSVSVVFTPPDKRRRDVDGMFSACKSLFDGIADVLGVDDSKWAFKELRREAPKKPGSVRVEIEVSA